MRRVYLPPQVEIYINKTGAPSVRGSVVSAHTTDGGVRLQNNEFDAIGVMLQDGIPDGQPCFIQCQGRCWALLEDGAGANASQLIICAPTDGRCLAIDVPSANPVVGEHFKELGHCVRTVAGGTNVLVEIQSHLL